MPIDWIDFSKAVPLKEMYRNQRSNKAILEGYDYKNLHFPYETQLVNFKILKIQKINNPQLYGMYLLWKEEMTNSDLYPLGKVQELTMYHATSRKNAKNIALNNIDWRKTRRSRFGKGACFSSSPEYAHRFASSTGALIVFQVLVKAVQKIHGAEYGLKVPSKKKCDTTSSNRGKVYVKYDDYQMYPKFIIHYRDELF